MNKKLSITFIIIYIINIISMILSIISHIYSYTASNNELIISSQIIFYLSIIIFIITSILLILHIIIKKDNKKLNIIKMIILTIINIILVTSNFFVDYYTNSEENTMLNDAKTILEIVKKDNKKLYYDKDTISNINTKFKSKYTYYVTNIDETKICLQNDEYQVTGSIDNLTYNKINMLSKDCNDEKLLYIRILDNLKNTLLEGNYKYITNISNYKYEDTSSSPMYYIYLKNNYYYKYRNYLLDDIEYTEDNINYNEELDLTGDYIFNAISINKEDDYYIVKLYNNILFYRILRYNESLNTYSKEDVFNIKEDIPVKKYKVYIDNNEIVSEEIIEEVTE